MPTSILNRGISRARRQGGGGGARSLLSAADFSYDGRYLIPNWWGGSAYGHGLTHRYVGGQLRLIHLPFAGNGPAVKFALQEFTLPGSFGGTVTAGTSWSDIWSGQPTGPGDPAYAGDVLYSGSFCHNGIWWDEANQLLWSNSALDYPAQAEDYNLTGCIANRTLNSNGTISNFGGFWGLQGVGARANDGGIHSVPSWFRTSAGVGPLVCGFGGYTSLMGQGLGPSLGPAFWFLNADPTGSAGKEFRSSVPTVASSGFKVGADHRSGATATTDWYGGGYASRTFDRGVRASTDVTNYYDSGDPRSNPTTAPTVAPAAGAQWLTPAPGDPAGWGRWTWGDYYFNTFNWVDDDAGTRTRHGIVLVASLNQGKCYYANSTLNSDAREYEIHVFDPADVAACVAGTLAPYKVRPTAAFAVSLPGLGGPSGGTSEPGGVVGATFDAAGGKLYLIGANFDAAQMYLYQFSVAGS